MKLYDILVEQDEEDKAAVEAAPSVVKDTADVAKHVYPLLQQKIEKINKRATKNKLPNITLEIVGEFMKRIEGDSPKDFREIPYLKVKVSGDTPRIAGYKFIATIEHQEGGNIIRTVPGEEGSTKIKAFYEAKPHYCDHCKKIRRRIDTFIIKKEDTGDLRQIGRNCLADFLGGVDPKAVLWYFDNRNDILKVVEDAEKQAGAKGVRAEQFVDIKNLLKVASAVISKRGYISQKKAQEIAAKHDGAGIPTTAQDVRWAVFYRSPAGMKLSDKEQELLNIADSAGPEDEQKAQQVLQWFQALPAEQKQSNEFMHNVDVLVKGGKVNPRNVGYAIALFPVYARAMDQIKPKGEQPKKSNEWIGQPGQKIPATKVNVIRTRVISGQYGSTQIVSMEDEQGNMYVWFNNSANDLDEGKSYTIVGTIKKHDEFNGRKQTHLTRVKAT